MDHDLGMSNCCYKLKDFVKYARDHLYTDDPVKLEDVFDWATCEGALDTLDIAKAMIKAGLMDVDYRAVWPGESHVKTTLLLSACEFRDHELAAGLLELGADVNAVTDGKFAFNVLDSIMMGHDCRSDEYVQNKTVKMFDLVLKYGPIMKLHPFVHKCFRENEWPGFRGNKRICDIVNKCS